MKKRIDLDGPQKARKHAYKLSKKYFPGSVLKTYSTEEMRAWTRLIFIAGYKYRKRQESYAPKAG